MPPRYLELDLQEIRERARIAVHSLSACRVCPRHCDVDRLQDKAKVCGVGRHAQLSTWYPHFGEEDCLRGSGGSGTLFFSFCNLKCVFCQNHDTSQQSGGVSGAARLMTAERLAAAMLDLQRQGCHNINFVTPEHVVPQILEALPLAIERGLRVPLIYNTSSYDALESLRWLDGLVDIYMPDFKLWSPERSRRYLKAKDYPAVARAALREMQRQVGSLQLERSSGLNLATSGLLVRHLVMPGMLDEASAIFEFLAREIAPDTYVNVMGQYYPDYQASAYPELNRRPALAEIEEARGLAQALGLRVDPPREPPRGRRLALV